MSDIVIRAENISKKYTLGTIGSGTLFRDLNMYWAKMRGKPNPYARLGENGTFQEGEHWALKDVSFEIKQGDAVGIIGRNGAGKSTLLKILSRVTTPTSGNIKIKGRVASLLEVGTGFHPEMTGRENIFLNGAILGMSKFEIKRKFDEIVDFAGVEKYIDTPVKRYSSGMYVRLAFGVAAHLEPEILIVDEVLAVGDAEFQKKCLGKMNDVSKNEGRTVLFVSHNMGAVKSLCTKGVLLKYGTLDSFDTIQVIVDHYNHHSFKVIYNSENLDYFRKSSLSKRSIYVDFLNCNGVSNELVNLSQNEQPNIHIGLKCLDAQKIVVNLFLKNSDGLILYSVSSIDYGFEKEITVDDSIKIKIDTKELNEGMYLLDIGINSKDTNQVLDIIQDYPIFNIKSTAMISYWIERPKGILFHPNIQWE